VHDIIKGDRKEETMAATRAALLVVSSTLASTPPFMVYP
jgi:hypothetical protein